MDCTRDRGSAAGCVSRYIRDYNFNVMHEKAVCHANDRRFVVSATEIIERNVARSLFKVASHAK